MIYENAEDRLNQDISVRRLCEAWRCDIVQTHTLAGADFLIVRQGVCKAVAEFKRRQCAQHQYPTLTIDESKIDKLVLAGKILHVPSLVIIQWNDVLGYARLVSVEGLQRGRQTRKHVRDAGDVDDRVYHLPKAMFTPI